MDWSFTKYQALGNDFVLFDWLALDSLIVDSQLADPHWPKQVQDICHRHLGVGADGVLILRQGPDGARADLYNADGSLAKFCGNGARCIAAHLIAQHHFPPKFNIDFGVHKVHCSLQDNEYMTSIPQGRYLEAHPITLFNHKWLGHRIDMGNPHLVIFAHIDLSWLTQHGAALEHYFPERTNVEFVWPEADGYYMLAYERGAGITQACGSGAMAVVQALYQLGKVKKCQSINITMLGGKVQVQIAESCIGLKAAAKAVFSGTLTPVEAPIFAGEPPLIPSPLVGEG